MINKIYTGSYNNCKTGNLISISGDRGRSCNFNGKFISKLAPKMSFWKVWHDNIEKISEEENTRYYIEEYYKQVLSKINIEELLRDEVNPILLCYDDSNMFCHRHVLAEYVNLIYEIEVNEIETNYNNEITIKDRPNNIRIILKDVIEKNKNIQKIKKL